MVISPLYIFFSIFYILVYFYIPSLSVSLLIFIHYYMSLSLVLSLSYTETCNAPVQLRSSLRLPGL